MTILAWGTPLPPVGFSAGITFYEIASPELYKRAFNTSTVFVLVYLISSVDFCRCHHIILSIRIKFTQ